MADYISREALLEKAWDVDTGCELVQVVDVGDILEAPAADVVEVVRCRYCEYWGDEIGRMRTPDGHLCDRCKAHSYLVGGRYIGLFPTEDDFCSSGKWRET